MKYCANVDCPAYQEGRSFSQEDTICPQCGRALVAGESGDDVNPHVGLGDPGAYGGTAPQTRPSEMGTVGMLLAALLIFLVMLGVAGVLIGLSNGFGPPGLATPRAGELGNGSATIVAQATRGGMATQLAGTPIVLTTPATTPGPGYTPGLAYTPRPVPGATITGGTTINDVGNNGGNGANGATGQVIPGISAIQLCRRLAAAQSCEPTTSYSSRDAYFNVAVQAGFGPGGARSASARWIDPAGRVLYTSPAITPALVGTYWVGFTLSQNHAWDPGNYYAEIYLDNRLIQQVLIPVVP